MTCSTASTLAYLHKSYYVKKGEERNTTASMIIAAFEERLLWAPFLVECLATAEGSTVGGSWASAAARCVWNSCNAAAMSGVVETICTNGCALLLFCASP